MVIDILSSIRLLRSPVKLQVPAAETVVVATTSLVEPVASAKVTVMTEFGSPVPETGNAAAFAALIMLVAKGLVVNEDAVSLVAEILLAKMLDELSVWATFTLIAPST